MMPISLFDGFINLHVGFFRKLGLWSFKVIKASFSAVQLILSASSSLVAILLFPRLVL